MTKITKGEVINPDIAKTLPHGALSKFASTGIMTS
jgi:hypothetical protein